MPIPRPTPALPALLALLVLTGCAEELGAERRTMKTAAISGVVLVQGRPVRGGWLEFLPVDGTVGLLRSAQVDEAGRFAADGVAVGTVAIRLVGFPPVEARLDPNLATFLGQIRQVYLIRRTIQPGATLTIDLAEEAYQRLYRP